MTKSPKNQIIIKRPDGLRSPISPWQARQRNYDSASGRRSFCRSFARSPMSRWRMQTLADRGHQP
jgi:hypothetical protein